MRLDKFLKVSRLIKRRTIANEACDAGKITVNGKTARASYEIKIGDVIQVSMGSNSITAEVTSIENTIRKENSVNMYRLIDNNH
jgi:ribosomal 50S subunit-recycling heat shock protein